MNHDRTAQLESLIRQATRTRGGSFTPDQVRLLTLYYELVLKWNRRLHLTTLTGPEDFFRRHLVESDLTEAHLGDRITEVWDLGTGLGIPGIPIAILRPDLQVRLVDSNRSKTIFLEEAISALNLDHAGVTCARLETLGNAPPGVCLTARAIDKFSLLIPEILRIGSGCDQILILGNPDLLKSVTDMVRDAKKIDAYPIPGYKMSILIELKSST